MTANTPPIDRAKGLFPAGLLLADRRRQALLLPVAIALVVVAGLAQQVFGAVNTDNSWLFTVGEKLFAGSVAYVDIIEANPPASIMLYMPAVLLGHALAISTELATTLLTFAGVVAALRLTFAMLSRACLATAAELPFLWLAGLSTLILFPGSCFAEREHIAAAAALPALVGLATRMAGRRPTLPHSLAAGLLAGLTVAIKPHFALALALPLAFAAARRRDWRLLFSLEVLVAALVIAAYAGSVLLVFPHYLDILPALMDAYVALREPLVHLLVQPWPLLQALLLAALGLGMWRCRRAPDLAILTSLASLGFVLAALAQGKGWINHYFGGVTLAILALAFFLAPLVPPDAAAVRAREWPTLRLAILFAVLPGLFGGFFMFREIYEEIYPGLAAAVTRVAPAHPSLIVLSGELNIGHPLVRDIDGVWAGRPGALWLTVTSGLRLRTDGLDEAYKARLIGHIHADAATFLEDVRRKRPDVILVEDKTYPKLLKLAPELAGALEGYVRREAADGIAVWTRQGL